MIMSTPYIFSIIGGILATMLLIYYQRRVSEQNNKKIEKSTFFYSAVFFISACLIHSLISGCAESKDIKLKNVFKVMPSEMKTGTPPF